MSTTMSDSKNDDQKTKKRNNVVNTIYSSFLNELPFDVKNDPVNLDQYCSILKSLFVDSNQLLSNNSLKDIKLWESLSKELVGSLKSIFKLYTYPSTFKGIESQLPGVINGEVREVILNAVIISAVCIKRSQENNTAFSAKAVEDFLTKKVELKLTDDEGIYLAKHLLQPKEIEDELDIIFTQDDNKQQINSSNEDKIQKSITTIKQFASTTVNPDTINSEFKAKLQSILKSPDSGLVNFIIDDSKPKIFNQNPDNAFSAFLENKLLEAAFINHMKNPGNSDKQRITRELAIDSICQNIIAHKAIEEIPAKLNARRTAFKDHSFLIDKLENSQLTSYLNTIKSSQIIPFDTLAKLVSLTLFYIALFAQCFVNIVKSFKDSAAAKNILKPIKYVLVDEVVGYSVAKHEVIRVDSFASRTASIVTPVFLNICLGPLLNFAEIPYKAYKYLYVYAYQHNLKELKESIDTNKGWFNMETATHIARIFKAIVYTAISPLLLNSVLKHVANKNLIEKVARISDTSVAELGYTVGFSVIERNIAKAYDNILPEQVQHGLSYFMPYYKDVEDDYPKTESLPDFIEKHLFSIQGNSSTSFRDSVAKGPRRLEL